MYCAPSQGATQQGGYQNGYQGGYQNGNQGGYQSGNQGGYQRVKRYQDGSKGGYLSGSQGGYQQRGSQGGYQQSGSQGVYQSGSQGGYQNNYQSGYQYGNQYGNQGQKRVEKGFEMKVLCCAPFYVIDTCFIASCFFTILYTDSSQGQMFTLFLSCHTGGEQERLQSQGTSRPLLLLRRPRDVHARAFRIRHQQVLHWPLAARVASPGSD